MAGTLEVPVNEQLKQLSNARKLVLGDTNYYPQIVQSVLPILNVGRPLAIRRWGADFLAEVFGSPALKMSSKENISLLVLETLKTLIQDTNEDSYVLRSAIETCSSVYPLVFNWMYVHILSKCPLLRTDASDMPAATTPMSLIHYLYP